MVATGHQENSHVCTEEIMCVSVNRLFYMLLFDVDVLFLDKASAEK